MFNPVAPYRYLLPYLYLSVADIAIPDLFECGSRTWISLDIACFYEELCQPSSGSALPACPKNGNRAPIAGDPLGARDPTPPFLPLHLCNIYYHHHTSNSQAVTS